MLKQYASCLVPGCIVPARVPFVPELPEVCEGENCFRRDKGLIFLILGPAGVSSIVAPGETREEPFELLPVRWLKGEGG